VYERVAADEDPDVRGSRRRRREKHQITGLKISGRHVGAGAVLFRNRPRDSHPMLREDVTDEAGTVETTYIGAAVSIRLAPQGEGGAADFVTTRTDR
jgi:hypothetical protein